MGKRLTIVLCLAVVVVLASASMAYANANSGYANWSAAGANATTPTPHAGYTTTTIKCAVCHAVHKGTNGGELLLRGTAGGSCEFCHIADNIGLVRLYAGNSAANYVTPGNAAHNDNSAGVAVGSRCVDCHAIHGANAMTDSSVVKFILKSTAAATGAPGGQSAQQASAVASRVAGDKESQVNAFCSMCHPYFQTAYNGTIVVSAYHAGGGTQAGTFQSHVMGPAWNSYGNSSATYSGKVAWVASTECRSCHDAGATNTQASFAIGLPGEIITESYPHYTPSWTRFMYSAAYSTAATTGTSYVPSNNNRSDTMPDGVCLKCHRGTSATTGVGYDF